MRLLYEANPLAYIVEQADGYASNGRGPVLDQKPDHVDQRTPLFIGNRELVQKCEEFLAAESES